MPQADVVNTFPDSQRRRAPREMGRQPQRAPFMKRAASGGSWPDGQSAERERERERERFVYPPRPKKWKCSPGFEPRREPVFIFLYIYIFIFLYFYI